MAGLAPSQESIRRFSSLARTLDPGWPPNRAVLILMPVAALVLGFFGAWMPGLADAPPIRGAASGAAVVLGAWALGRELAPDDQRAAFVAMALGLAALILVPSASLVLLFATLAMARMLSRSVGLPARVLDGIAVLILTGWSMASTRSLGVGLVGAGAFGLDAVLPGGLRRQWGFSALSLALVSVLAVRGESVLLPVPPGAPVLVAGASATALFLYVLLRTRTVHATGDATGEPLSALRVRWGMAVTLVMAIQAPLLGEGSPGPSALIWATLVAVAISGAAPSGARPDRA